MVPLNRSMTSSYRLSVVTMPLSAAVWPQLPYRILALIVAFDIAASP